MLDNPNLSSDKMIEVMSFGESIIGYSLIVVIAVLIYLYRYEIKLFFKHGFSNDNSNSGFLRIFSMFKNDISELEREEISSKVDSLIEKFNKSDFEIDKNTELHNDEMSSNKKQSSRI